MLNGWVAMKAMKSDESDDHDYSDDHSEQTTNGGGDNEDGTIHGETNRIYYGGGVDGLVAVRSGTRRE